MHINFIFIKYQLILAISEFLLKYFLKLYILIILFPACIWEPFKNNLIKSNYYKNLSFGLTLAHEMHNLYRNLLEGGMKDGKKI